MRLVKMLFIAVYVFLIWVPAARADFAQIEENYSKIKTVSVRIETVIANKKARISQKSRLMMNGWGKRRFDQIAPDRAVYIISGQQFINFDFESKKETRKKLSELSDVHLIFLDELFHSTIFNPVKTLMNRYTFPEFRKGYKNLNSPIIGISLRDPNARVKINFSGTEISSLEYYFKNNLNKKTVFSNYTMVNGVSLPSKTTITIFGEMRTEIEIRFSGIIINKDINNAYFEKINP